MGTRSCRATALSGKGTRWVPWFIFAIIITFAFGTTHQICYLSLQLKTGILLAASTIEPGRPLSLNCRCCILTFPPRVSLLSFFYSCLCIFMHWPLSLIASFAIIPSRVNHSPIARTKRVSETIWWLQNWEWECEFFSFLSIQLSFFTLFDYLTLLQLHWIFSASAAAPMLVIVKKRGEHHAVRSSCMAAECHHFIAR